ncbi:hypothetical protein EE612_033579, partial [Oryza sativa]
VCLRNLHVPYDTISSIPRIGKLTCLEYLNAFSVQKRIGHTVCELKNLSQLHHLRLRDIQNVGSYKEVLDANLKDKKHMRTFSLHWSSHEVVAESVSDLVLDNLQPHSDLEELDIIGFSGTRLPFWITDSYLKNIVSLNIINCCKIEHVPSLASLCSLKNLFLRDLPLLASMGCMLHECDKIPVGCSHSFQKCPSSINISEEMVDVESEGVSFSPHLSTLIIRGCPQLMKLPTLPSMLKQLKIEKSGLMLLPKMYQNHNDTEGSLAPPNESQLTNVLIEYCPNLKSLLHCFLGQNVTLTSLRELHINKCEKLEYLPLNGLMELVNLQILEVLDCSMLKKSGMEVKLLPSSLEQLSIKSCGEVENILIDLLAGLEALTFLKLANCSHLISLPSVETFETLTALRLLGLYDCPELSSLGGLQCLTSLSQLTICRCSSLTKNISLQPPSQCWSSEENVIVNSLKLGTLIIDDHSLLFVEPIRSFQFTRRLSLLDDHIMTSLPEQWLLQNRMTLSSLWLWNVKSLQCLPSSMKDLCHLQSFTLFNAPLVNSLPDMPASLKDLTIDCCHTTLADRCRKGGCDWSKIAHVTLVKIDCNEP